MGGGGVRKASVVAEKIVGGRHRVGGGVESPQSDDTPRVAKDPREDQTPGGTTSAEGGPGEYVRRRGGGDKNPPTSLATRMQRADGGNGALMGGQRTEEPTDTMETEEEDGSAGT